MTERRAAMYSRWNLPLGYAVAILTLINDT